MGDILSWDTYLHVLAVLQHRDLKQITCKWFRPSVPCLPVEMEQQVWRSPACRKYL